MENLHATALEFFIEVEWENVGSVDPTAKLQKRKM